jgi:hypothetical protein
MPPPFSLRQNFLLSADILLSAGAFSFSLSAMPSPFLLFLSSAFFRHFAADAIIAAAACRHAADYAFHFR